MMDFCSTSNDEKKSNFVSNVIECPRNKFWSEQKCVHWTPGEVGGVKEERVVAAVAVAEAVAEGGKNVYSWRRRRRRRRRSKSCGSGKNE